MDYTFDNPLVSGTLIKRYKRFLADVEMEGGTVITAHCANTGSMKGCAEPGSTVYLSKSNNPKRKLAYSLELVKVGDTTVGVNTALPNGIVAQAIARGVIPELAHYGACRREVRYAEKSRIDLLLEEEGQAPCYVEVKNVTLEEQGRALFPDAVTERGRRHLNDMLAQVGMGDKAAMVYLIQRTDCTTFSPADAIDPQYGEALRKAVEGGVMAFALVAEASPEGIRVTHQVPVCL